MAIDFPNSPVSGQEYSVGSTTWVYDNLKWTIKTVNAATNDSMPVGAIMWFAGSSAPVGWIACDGSAVSRSTYSTLFSVVGTTYGSGNGSSTFNVPDITALEGAYYVRYSSAIGVKTTESLTTAPLGTMLDWPITSSYPTGWLRSDGFAVSRTSYNDLFGLIGTTYGAGDGSTTFNLPDMAAAGSGSPVKIIKATLSGGVEPSTVSHAATHIRGGSDVIDADRAQIDFVPSFYTRNASVSEAGASTDLAAHLSGIDRKFSSFVSATGGSESTYTDYTGATYKVHRFINVGTSTLTINSGGIVSILVVGGGGGGASRHNGGGGGGGVLYAENYLIGADAYAVTVGAGGVGNNVTGSNAGNSGGNSSVSGGSLLATAIGGGASGKSGGSGGGYPAGYATNYYVSTQTAPVGFSAFGTHGGDGTPGSTEAGFSGGGGGGATTPGRDALPRNAGTSSSQGGNGGDGFPCSITGVMTHYAGGGGGSTGPGSNGGGKGGRGGGTDGTVGFVNATNAAANTGGGGGAAGFSGSSNARGGDGGSGIVIVRYRIS
jgi:microcystin-dependent protein